MTTPARISTRTWLIMAALALTGQIAWAVENSWFLIYDRQVEKMDADAIRAAHEDLTGWRPSPARSTDAGTKIQLAALCVTD